MLTNSSGSMTAFSASRTVSSAIAITLPFDAIILPGQGTRLIVRKPNQDLVARNLNLVGFRRLGRRHRHGRAGFNVEFRPMPRASDRSVLRIKRPVTQRPAVMCADVVERIEMARRTD